MLYSWVEIPEMRFRQYLLVSDINICLYRYMKKNPLDKYIQEIDQIYKSGNATEHSYRPALKTLIES
ncbi:MAG: hypothetical protein DRP51_07945, partial [Candidatus Zixiibacteriota bacterium]